MTDEVYHEPIKQPSDPNQDMTHRNDNDRRR